MQKVAFIPMVLNKISCYPAKVQVYATHFATFFQKRKGKNTKLYSHKGKHGNPKTGPDPFPNYLNIHSFKKTALMS
jgi:hypothetical protein